MALWVTSLILQILNLKSMRFSASRTVLSFRRMGFTQSVNERCITQETPIPSLTTLVDPLLLILSDLSCIAFMLCIPVSFRSILYRYPVKIMDFKVDISDMYIETNRLRAAEDMHIIWLYKVTSVELSAYLYSITRAAVVTAVAPRTAQPLLQAPFRVKTYAQNHVSEVISMVKFYIHLPISQLKCLSPLNEWYAKGAANIVFPATLRTSGSPATNSITWAESKTLGAARYARAYPYKTKTHRHIYQVCL